MTLAREWAELTGETDSQLFEWIGQHAATADCFKSRQTFYTWMNRDGWQRSTSRTLTQDCHLTSYPLSCRLRLRAFSWTARFKRDLSRETERQMVLLAGYEVCSRLLHIRLYQGPDHPIGDPAFAPCLTIPVSTTASFVEECARLVGLPIQQVLFTQQWFAWPAGANTAQVYLSLPDKRLVLLEKREVAGDSALRCAFAVDLPRQPAALKQIALPGFADWFGDLHPATLIRTLSAMVNLHNKTNALARLEAARKKLDALIAASQKKLDATSTDWSPLYELSDFQTRVARHEYRGDAVGVREVAFYHRDCLKFEDTPGDRDG